MKNFIIELVKIIITIFTLYFLNMFLRKNFDILTSSIIIYIAIGIVRYINNNFFN